MQKNTATVTATTFNLPFILFPEMVDEWAAAEMAKPYVWKNEADARTAVGRLDKHSDGHETHYAPGLEVHAFYTAVPGRDALELYTVIVFEDDTAARLHKAVRRGHPVTTTYVKADGEEVVRTIEPRSLKTTQAGDVIVKALDRKSGEHRSFRLDRVRTYTVHRTRFTVAEPVKAGPEPVVRTVTDIYDTRPGSAAVLEAPEAVQDAVAERYALGYRYAFVTV